MLDINHSDIRQLTLKLEQVHRKHLPLAVKGALNKAAVSMKSGARLIEEEFKDNFTIRRPSFIRSHTGFQKVEFSQWDINRMESKAGILKGKSKSGDNLKLQEEGGNLNERFVPTRHTRIGESDERKQKAEHYFNKYRNKPYGQIIRNKRVTVIKTKKSLLAVTKGGNWKTLYTLANNAKINKNPFVEPAGKKAGANIRKYYEEEAKRQLSKAK